MLSELATCGSKCRMEGHQIPSCCEMLFMRQISGLQSYPLVVLQMPATPYLSRGKNARYRIKKGILLQGFPPARTGYTRSNTSLRARLQSNKLIFSRSINGLATFLLTQSVPLFSTMQSLGCNS